MNECQQAIEKDQDEEPRKDILCYCPRVDKEILLLDSRCFSPNRGPVCSGCVFDVDRIYVKLMLLLCEILQSSGKGKVVSAC
jgi:hypothetical protein